MSTFVVLGANGISGLAICEHLLSLPSSEVKKVIAVSRRPPPLEKQDDRLVHLSIDLLKTTASEFADRLKNEGGSTIDVAFFFLYVEKPTLTELTEVNKQLLQVSLDGMVEATQGKLGMVHLQMGYKYYGVFVPNPAGWAPRPFKEDAPPRNSEQLQGSPSFNQVQRSLLEAHAQKHGYTWSDSRPNPIIGVAKGSMMSMAVTLAVFLATEKHKGTKSMPFPGNDLSWNQIKMDLSTATANAEFQYMITKKENRGKSAGQGYNIRDDPYQTYEHVFGVLGKAFGIDFTAPTAKVQKGSSEMMVSTLSLEEWSKDERNVAAWKDLCKEAGIDDSAYAGATWGFTDFCLSTANEMTGSMDKAREIGWTKQVKSAEDGFIPAFHKLASWGMIPPL